MSKLNTFKNDQQKQSNSEQEQKNKIEKKLLDCPKSFNQKANKLSKSQVKALSPISVYKQEKEGQNSPSYLSYASVRKSKNAKQEKPVSG